MSCKTKILSLSLEIAYQQQMNTSEDDLIGHKLLLLPLSFFMSMFNRLWSPSFLNTNFSPIVMVPTLSAMKHALMWPWVGIVLFWWLVLLGKSIITSQSLYYQTCFWNKGIFSSWTAGLCRWKWNHCRSYSAWFPEFKKKGTFEQGLRTKLKFSPVLPGRPALLFPHSLSAGRLLPPASPIFLNNAPHQGVQTIHLWLQVNFSHSYIVKVLKLYFCLKHRCDMLRQVLKKFPIAVSE